MTANPRLREGLAFIPIPGGYVVEGGRDRRRLTGSLASEAIPILLPLLDGSRSFQQIAEVVDPSALRVLGMLWREDLVRFGDVGEPHPMRTFLRRSHTGWAAEHAWRRLRSASVAVLGEHVLADLVAGLLAESGVGNVLRQGPADLTVDLSDVGNDPAQLGIVAGEEVGRTLRRLVGPLSAVPPPTPATRRHLTEPRIPLRRSPYPRVRTLAWILAGRGRTPRMAPAAAIRTYLLGDLGEGAHAYAFEEATETLVRLPGTVTDTVRVVLTAGRPKTRSSAIDTGHILAQLVDDAHAAGWHAAVTHVFEEEVLDLDPEREHVTAALELTPVREVRRPRRRTPSSGVVNPRELTERAIAQARLLRPGASLRHSWHTADTDTWITDYATACGLSPTALLVFEIDKTGETDESDGTDDPTIQAALTAETIRRHASRAGLACALLPDLGTYNPRTPYACAFGEAAGIPADAVW